MPILTPHVPNGLIDLMKNLAKEVLRDKPENIYEFAAVHLENLIKQRDGSLNKGYEEFVAFEAHFDGQQRFAVPANSGYKCQRPIKIQPMPQSRKSKSDIMASFQAMESINEEDVLLAVGETPYTDEKYQKAIYVIQRYFRRYMAKKKNLPSSTSLSASTAAVIIQRTMRSLFSNKKKFKTTEKDSTATAVAAAAVKLNQDDVDNVSEAASYTSSSTIQMLADGQEGRENRLPSGEGQRLQREEVLEDGGADLSSLEFKEQSPRPPSPPQPVAVVDDDEEHSHSHSHSGVVEEAATEMDRKSISDENGNIQPTLQDAHHPTSESTSDDTSTAHIGLLSTKIDSNDHQNSPYTNIVDIDRNRSQPIHTNTKSYVVAAAVASATAAVVTSVPLNYPQSLGATPDTLPATSPNLERTQETFAINLLDNGIGKNNDASVFHGSGRIRKFDPDTGEALKIYDVFYQNINDPEFSDSLNESTMEKDSLEPEELDVDSLEFNENMTHVSGLVKRETVVKQDDGSLYGDADNDIEEEDVEGEQNDGQKFTEHERVPTYLYGIHPARTPVPERKAKIRNSSESDRMPLEVKQSDEVVGVEMRSKTPEEKSEEASLESKCSTSEESSATQIENNLAHSRPEELSSAIGKEPDYKDPSKNIHLVGDSALKNGQSISKASELKSETDTIGQKQSHTEKEGDDSGLTLEMNSGQLAVHSSKDNLSSEEHSAKEEKSEEERVTNLLNVNQGTDSQKAASAKLIDSERKPLSDGNSPEGKVLSNQMKPYGDKAVQPEQETYQVDDALSIPEGEIAKESKENVVSEENSHKSSEDGTIAFKNQTQNQLEEPTNTLFSSAQSKDLKNTELNNQPALGEKNELSSAVTDSSSLSIETMNATGSRASNMQSNEVKDNLKNSREVVLEDLASVSEKDIQSESISGEFGTGNDEANAPSKRRKRSLGMSPELEEGVSANDDLLGNLEKQVSSSNLNEEKNSTVDGTAPISNKSVEENVRTSDENLNIAEEASQDKNENVEVKTKNAESLEDSNASEEIPDKKGSNQQNSLLTNARTTAEESFSDSAASQFWFHDEAIESQLQELQSLNDGVSDLEEQNHETKLLSDDTRSDEVIHSNAHTSEVLVNGEEVKHGGDEILKTISNLNEVKKNHQEHPIDKKDSTATESVGVSSSQKEEEGGGKVSSPSANVNAMNSEEASEETTKVIQAAESSNPSIAEEVFDQSTNLGVVGSGALVGLHAYAISSLDSNEDKRTTEDSNKSLSLKSDDGDGIEQKIPQKTDISNLTPADALKNSSSEEGVTKLASQSLLKEEQEINKNLKPSSLENTLKTGKNQIVEAGNASQSSKKSPNSTEDENSSSDKDKHKIEESHDGNYGNKKVLNEETNSISGLIDGEAMLSGTSGNEESVIKNSASGENSSTNPDVLSLEIDDENKNTNKEEEASELMGKLSRKEESGDFSTTGKNQSSEPDIQSKEQLEANFVTGDLITKKHLGEDNLEKGEGEALSAIEEVKKQTNGALISSEDVEIDTAMEKDPKNLQELVESTGTQQDSKTSAFKVDSKNHQSTEAEKMERLGAGDSELKEPGLKKETKTTDVTRIQDNSGSDGKDLTPATKLEKGNQEKREEIVVQKNDYQSHEDPAESRKAEEKKDEEATVKVKTDRPIVEAGHVHSASLQSPTDEEISSKEEPVRMNDFTSANSPLTSLDQNQETQGLELKRDKEALDTGTVVLEKVDKEKDFSELTSDKSDESEKEAKQIESSTTLEDSKEDSKSNPKTEGTQEKSDRVNNSKESKEKSSESEEELSAAVETELSISTDKNVEKKIPDSEVNQITEHDIKKEENHHEAEATARKLQDTDDSKSDLKDKDTDEKGDPHCSSKASKGNRTESEEDHHQVVEIEHPVPTTTEKDTEKEKSSSEMGQLPEKDNKKKLSSTETEVTTEKLQDTKKDSKSDQKAKDSNDKGDRVCSSKAFKAISDKSNADPSAAVQTELPSSTDKGEEKKIPDSEVKQIFEDHIKKEEILHETESTERKLQDIEDSKSSIKDKDSNEYKNSNEKDDGVCRSKTAKEKSDVSKEEPSTAIETELPSSTDKAEEKKIPDFEIKENSEDDIKKEENLNETEILSRQLQNPEDSKSESKANDSGEKGGHVCSSKTSKGNPDESEEGHFPAELPVPIPTEKEMEKEALNSELGQLHDGGIKQEENPNVAEATARKAQDTEEGAKNDQKPEDSDDKTKRVYSSKAVKEKFDQSKEDPSAAVETKLPSSTDKAEEKKISDSEIEQLSKEVIKEKHNPMEQLTQGDKMVQENHEKVTRLESTELMSHAGSSADTSADFSSIGKDLEFFEDTIKYLKEATEHLGAMDDAFEEKKDSIPTPKITEDLSQSAVVIQSAFRGYQARKQLNASNRKDGGVVEDQDNNKASKAPNKGLSRDSASQRERNIDSEVNLNSAEIKARAATKIQSTYRGFRQRKAIKNGEGVIQRTKSEPDDVQTSAATKIQSTYRGHRVRRSLKESQSADSRKQIDNPEVGKPVGTPTKHSFEVSPEKSPIPVAVIHPTKYPTQSSSVDSFSTRRTTQINVNRSNAAVSVTKLKKRASSVNESTTKRIATSSTRPIKSDQNSPTKVTTSQSSQRTVSLSRQRPIEKNSRNVRTDSLEGTNVASSPEKLINNLDKTVKSGQISAQKLATISSSGYNRKPTTIKSKTPSTPDLIERPRETVRELFERKRKSTSTSGKDKTQTSFNLEVIRQELLSTKVKTPPQSGRKKKVNSGVSHQVRNGSLTKQPKGTKILQKSTSTTSDESKSLNKVEPVSEDLEVRTGEVANTEEQSANNHDNSTLSARIQTPDQVPTVQTKEERKSLSKTYTIRSSLNEMADSDLQANKVTKEVLGDIDLESPPDLFEKPEHDVNTQEASATKIQKTYRGYRVRRSLRNTKSEGDFTKGAKVMSKTSTESSISQEMKTKTPSQNQTNQQEGKRESEERKEVSATTEERNLNESEKVISMPSNNDVKEQTRSVPNLPIQSKDSKNHALEKSATTIQKTYRGYRSRKNLESLRAEKATESKESSGLELASVQDMDENQPMSQEPQETKNVLKQRNEENETLDIFESLKKDFEDYKATALDKSATTIQRHFRGYKTRKSLKSKGSKEQTKIDTSGSTDQLDKKTRGDDELREISELKESDFVAHKNDIKLESSNSALDLRKDSQSEPIPDLDNSAKTIQKTFRGYRTRKHLQKGDKNKNVPENQNQTVEEIIKVKTGDKKVLQENQKETIEGSDKPNVEEDPGVFDSFDVEEFHNQVLQKSATTIQKTFRGYQTRKELLARNEHLKTIEECPEIKQSDPMPNEAATTIQSSYRGYRSRKALAKPQNSTNKHSSIPIRVPNKSQADGKEIENIVQVSPNMESENLNTSTEVSADQSGVLKNAAKSASAGAVLENAASTIQKAYRHYHAKKTSSSTNSTNSHGIQRETTPKEGIENSDESSIFIGPDTSFDLSDVDSVDTRSDKIGLNGDKLSSSEAPTPVYDEEEDPESTITIKIHSEDKEVENDEGNTPEKLRRKRSIMDPTAPPLEDIHHQPTITSSDQKPKWFVGDDLIIPSEDGSAKPSSLPNPLVCPPAPSRFDELSSIDEYRENSNSSSNQQLLPSIESAVVSTSSLLLANITEMHGKNNLNKPSETVSANEEEENLNLESEAKPLGQIDGTNGESIDKGVAPNDMKLSGVFSEADLVKNPDVGSKDLNEDKADDEKKDTVTELCKNCADGIHEGGLCTTESMKMKDTTEEKSTKDLRKHPESPDKHVDQIKEFVLMEESNSSPSTSENKEQDTKKADKSESSTTAVNESKSSELKMKENESGNRDSVHENTSQTLKPNDCPAISLIPPSSEDDTSGGETIHEPEKKNVGGNEETTPELVADTKIVDEKTEPKKETSESMETNFKTGSETEDFTETSKEELSSNEHNADTSEKANETVKNTEETNPTPELNGSKNLIEKEGKDVSGSKDSTEDTHFEDDFSDSENITNDLIKKPADENQTSDDSAEEQQPHDHEAITPGKVLQEGSDHARNTVDELEKPGSQEEIKSLKLEGVSSDVATANNVKSGDENSRFDLQENEEKTLNGSKDISEEVSLITMSLSSFEGQDQSASVKVDPEIAETKKEELNEEVKSKSENIITEEEKTKTSSHEKLITAETVSEEASSLNEGKGEKSFEGNQADNKEDDKPSQEDIEIASELIARSLSLEEKQKSSDTSNKLQTNVVEDSSPKNETGPEDIGSTETMKEQKSTSHSDVISHVEKLIEDNLKPSEGIANTVDLKDLPTKDSSQEVDEVPCVKVEVLPRTPISVSSDPDESELESTTTKAESTTTTPGYDDGSENDAAEILTSKPDELDAMTEKLRETEAMVARMRQRRASEQRISIDSVSDQPVTAFEEPICEPIKPMQRLQKSSSTEVEDEYVLQKLQRGDTTRESSAQSESVIFGETSSHLTETDDTFNENMDLHALHRANTITSNRGSAKPPGHLYKSVTIDDTVKYIDPEKSTEESAGSFSMDDTMSEDVRKKMMAYSVSEADSDYYDLGDQTSRPHDDFNISTALDNFPSTDTDTTIVSAATKIQAGARGFLTRRRRHP